jgi:hypothetical protein
MKIAIDYDNTFTADPQLWADFLNMARERGHEVAIVTSRFPHMKPQAIGIEVICCSFTAKRKHHQADIWIDDDPYHIDHDHDPSLFSSYVRVGA